MNYVTLIEGFFYIFFFFLFSFTCITYECFTRISLYPTIQYQVLATVVAPSVLRNFYISLFSPVPILYSVSPDFFFLPRTQLWLLRTLALYLYSPLCAPPLAHIATRKTTENLGRSTAGYRPNRRDRRKNFSSSRRFEPSPVRSVVRAK